MPNPQTKRDNYFSFIPDEEIDRKLDYLIKRLPRKCTKRNYQLSKQLLKITNRSVKESGLQANLQGIADRMREHLQIEKPIKILTMKNIGGGKFERLGNLNCIYINGDLTKQNYHQKIAILAHEMSHYYLIYQHNIHLPQVEENELLTELNAIFTGFGFLLLEGYGVFRIRRGNTAFESKVGYIKLHTIRKAIIKTAYLRKQNPIWILKNVGIANVPYFSIGLFPLVKDYYKARQKKSKNL